MNVALRVGDGVAAAAMADPFSGEVFWADGETARIRVDGRDESWVAAGRHAATGVQGLVAAGDVQVHADLVEIISGRARVWPTVHTGQITVAV